MSTHIVNYSPGQNNEGPYTYRSLSFDLVVNQSHLLLNLQGSSLLLNLDLHFLGDPLVGNAYTGFSEVDFTGTGDTFDINAEGVALLTAFTSTPGRLIVKIGQGDRVNMGPGWRAHAAPVVIKGIDYHEYTQLAPAFGGFTHPEPLTLFIESRGPLAHTATYSIYTNTTFSVSLLPLVTNTDHDKLSFASSSFTTTLGNHGTMTAAGIATINTTAPNVHIYDAVPGSILHDSFTYQVSNGFGGISKATITLDERVVKEIPVAVADLATTHASAPELINVLANDKLGSDAPPLENAAKNALATPGMIIPTITLESGLSNDGAALSLVYVNGASVSTTPKAGWIPEVNYNPSGVAALQLLGAGVTTHDSFHYTITTPQGSSSVTDTVTVTGVNDAVTGVVFTPLSSNASGIGLITEDVSGTEIGAITLQNPVPGITYVLRTNNAGYTVVGSELELTGPLPAGPIQNVIITATPTIGALSDPAHAVSSASIPLTLLLTAVPISQLVNEGGSLGPTTYITSPDITDTFTGTFTDTEQTVSTGGVMTAVAGSTVGTIGNALTTLADGAQFSFSRTGQVIFNAFSLNPATTQTTIDTISYSLTDAHGATAKGTDSFTVIPNDAISSIALAGAEITSAVQGTVIGTLTFTHAADHPGEMYNFTVSAGYELIDMTTSQTSNTLSGLPTDHYELAVGHNISFPSGPLSVILTATPVDEPSQAVSQAFNLALPLTTSVTSPLSVGEGQQVSESITTASPDPNQMFAVIRATDASVSETTTTTSVAINTPVQLPDGAILTISNDGEVTYDTAGMMSIPLVQDTLNYTIEDNHGDKANGTLTFDVTVPFYYTDISAGSGGGYALSSAGTVYAWGDNCEGSLGNGGMGGTSSTPAEVVGINDIGVLSNIVSVAGGYTAALALDNNGDVYAWGYLGNHAQDTPVQAQDISGIVSIVGSQSEYALNTYGQVYVYTEGSITGTPTLMTDFPTNTDIVAMAVSASPDVYALSGTGNVYAWGSNTRGELGNDTSNNTDITTTPVEVLAVGATIGGPALQNIVAIATAYDTVYALSNAGNVYAWGASSTGELGNGTTIDSYTPVQVSNLQNIIEIAGGLNGGYALSNVGNVYAWGDNTNGELGNTSLTQSSTPVKVEGVSGVGYLGDAISTGGTGPIVAISANNIDGTAYALSSTGQVYAWGSNGNSELGNGPTTTSITSSSTPVEIYSSTQISSGINLVDVGVDFTGGAAAGAAQVGVPISEDLNWNSSKDYLVLRFDDLAIKALTGTLSVNAGAISVADLDAAVYSVVVDSGNTIITFSGGGTLTLDNTNFTGAPHTIFADTSIFPPGHLFFTLSSESMDLAPFTMAPITQTVDDGNAEGSIHYVTSSFINDTFSVAVTNSENGVSSSPITTSGDGFTLPDGNVATFSSAGELTFNASSFNGTQTTTDTLNFAITDGHGATESTTQTFITGISLSALSQPSVTVTNTVPSAEIYGGNMISAGDGSTSGVVVTYTITDSSTGNGFIEGGSGSNGGNGGSSGNGGNSTYTIEGAPGDTIYGGNAGNGGNGSTAVAGGKGGDSSYIINGGGNDHIYVGMPGFNGTPGQSSGGAAGTSTYTVTDAGNDTITLTSAADIVGLQKGTLTIDGGSAAGTNTLDLGSVISPLDLTSIPVSTALDNINHINLENTGDILSLNVRSVLFINPNEDLFVQGTSGTVDFADPDHNTWTLTGHPTPIGGTTYTSYETLGGQTIYLQEGLHVNNALIS